MTKKSISAWLVAILFAASFNVFAGTRPVKDVTGEISANTHWVKDTIYLLKGYVYVKENSGATLTIDPGTIIKGDKSTKGALIVERGAKIWAVGSVTEPIVFTSNQPKGQRSAGDWGGIIICGKGIVNNPAGQVQVEGGPRSFYGGTDNTDSSGALKYVRIEFGGIAFAPNSEINGLTMGGVGSKTLIDFIQVSWSGDDSYEWFGGAVNVKHLISYACVDDDFDTDFGYSGMVQYGLAMRDQYTNDVSSSKGFESDNTGTAYNFLTPYTRCVFSNMTSMGPLLQLKDTSTAGPLFICGFQARRNSRISLVNSVIAGWSYGWEVSQVQCDSVIASKPTNGDLMFMNNYIAGVKDTFPNDNFKPSAGASNGPNGAKRINMRACFNASGSGNVGMLAASSSSKYFTDQLETENTWGLDGEKDTNLAVANYYVMPKSGSKLLSGASFSASRLNNSFFDKVSFCGAFGSTDWTSGWANFNPQMLDYTNSVTGINDEVITPVINTTLYPQPADNKITVNFFLTQPEYTSVSLYDVTGKEIQKISNENMSAGQHTVNADVTNLSNGLYIIKIKTSQSCQSYKMVVAGK